MVPQGRLPHHASDSSDTSTAREVRVGGAASGIQLTR